jgi:ABC-2 type transport system permease protein
MTALTQNPSLVRPPLPRLTAVELRKMIDTRAGFCLLVLIGLTAVAAVVIPIAVDGADAQTMAGLFIHSIEAVTVLLSILALLAVTSEWSQRTALTTFALVPARGRVVGAKTLAASALTLASVLACVLAAAAGTAVAGAGWSFDLSQLASGALWEYLSMLSALAIGLLLMHTTAATVTYFVTNMIVSLLAQTIPALSGPSEWFDPGHAMAPLLDDAMGAGDWARLTVCTVIWVALPFALGFLRLRRSEFK